MVKLFKNSKSEDEPILVHHTLKTWPRPFSAVWSGHKRFEFRKNDRGFEVGQTLRLAEYIPRPAEDELGGFYTDRWLLVIVTHIERAPAFGIPADFVVLSITVLARSDAYPPPRYLDIDAEERTPSFA